MAECLIFDDPAVTWSYSCILEQREMARKAIWDFFALDIVSLLLLPLFPLWVLVCRIRISTFTNRLRHIRLQHDRPASADS